MGYEPLPASSSGAMDPLTGYGRIAFYYNPHSRRGGQHEQDMQLLGSTGLEVVPYTTFPEIGANAELLGRVGEAGDLNVFRGGDGTACTMLSAAKAVESEAPNLVLARGRINDLAGQLVTDQGRFADPAGIIRDGTIRSLHPLEVTFAMPDGQTKEHQDVWSSCGIGASAWASAAYNRPSYRYSGWHRLPGITYAVEHAIAASSLAFSERFIVEDKGGEGPIKLVERIIASGSQMGGDLRIAADIFAPESRVIDGTSRAATAVVVGRMLLNQPTGRTIEADETLTFTAQARHGIRVQVGGEVSVYPSGVQMSLRRSPDAVRVFTLAV